MTVLAAGALLLSGACRKQPEAPKEIVIPASSQAVFSNGMGFDYTGPQAKPVAFTAPDSWVAAVSDAKVPGWISVSPSSGKAGDVTLLVTAQANGSVEERTAKVTIKSAGKSASFTVRQEGKPVPVESVKLDKTTLSLTEGDDATLTATVKPDNAANKTVSWSSSNAAVATVDANGKVTAVKAGTATITAKAGDKTATCSVTVAAKVIAVTGVTLDKTSLSLTEGDAATLKATVTPANATNKTVTWSSSDASVASVDGNGKVTALKLGSATITATAGGQSATCEVTVDPVPVDSITLNKTSVTLKVGQSITLTATVNPSNATDKTVTWNSSDPTVATIDADGKLTAITPGLVTIYANAGGTFVTCEVTVALPDGGWEGMTEENW